MRLFSSPLRAAAALAILIAAHPKCIARSADTPPQIIFPADDPVTRALNALPRSPVDGAVSRTAGAAMTMTILRSVCADSFPEFQKQNLGAYEHWRKANGRALSDIEGNAAALILRNSQGDKSIAGQVEKRTAEQLRTLVLQNVRGGDANGFELQCRFFPKVLEAMSMETRFAAELKMMRDHPIK
jgi:hypothetical protein